ncbi:MAG: DUF721 domain-containing protein [Treponema sp.]|jgi:hypothetical protein|nr:DUF721 domain-containing protein [Treponema sp.]
MKRAGEYLAAIIDVDLLKKAKTYSVFFSSWAQICQNCGMAAAAGHTRIRDLEKGLLVVEADHPGWVQILQTKAQWILDQTRRRFPELDIRGISLTLSKGEVRDSPRPADPAPQPAVPQPVAPRPVPEPKSGPKDSPGFRIGVDAWERIEDKDFKDSLKRLERSIREREKSASEKGKK